MTAWQILNERGDVISSSIGKNRDSDTDSRLFQTQLIEDEDVQKVQQFQFAGFESRPPDGTKIIVTDLGDGAFKISVAEDDGILNDTLGKGESIVYSSSGGAVVASLYLTKEGKIQLGNGTDELLSLLNDNLTEVILGLKYFRDDSTYSNGGGPTGPPSNGASLTPIIENLEDTQTALANIRV